MNCQCCGRPRTFDSVLCQSCLDDCESGLAAIDHDESILDRLLREQRIRAKMPRFGLKPEIK
jgi:hypothetical protein